VLFQHTAARRRLLQYCYLSSLCHSCFNTQPRRGGCYNIVTYHLCAIAVSTHSRAKAAAGNRLIVIKLDKVSTHSRAKAAAFGMVGIHLDTGVSTHSHPKVAAYYRHIFLLQDLVFQHTATRRWLPSRQTQIKTR